ncbi:uncharacterized protein LOC135207444, partial [Macrobrachium nipponense]|uniref:uncharacterized protein LOC135207444 n=1 Tax=Macrobrachium nipponense TaxID=159736 RepID=UPI0030C81CE4
MDSWRPNPRAPPFIPRRFSARLEADGSGASPHRHRYLAMIPRGRRLAKFLQCALMLVLVATIIINVSFIVDKTRQLRAPMINTESDGDGGGAGVGRRNNLRLQESPPKTLTVDVISSQNRVAVTVDGATIVEESDSIKK